ncbi:carbohydrate-binding protein [Flavitalea sp. BT771]|uniref:carbohydrate-binding protein n=1 Tax=Flavitalea sp. BT771 TaxID=3063329 RepID=UPI0026E225E1|nr:carbohydrate-binding protein [Flavitalea sp. BT771]MDO6433455.1 carbohydrate-binding protein [Flavitalea sp. BT771]MDV6222640.1 carbohydrate-binding protein [Flavitalea sp. BT771]
MKMKILLKTFVVLLSLLLTAGVADAQFKVVGYMPSWAGSVSAVQYSKLTHINYAFLLPNADGSLQAIDNASKLQSLVSTAHANGVKAQISVGGWNNGDDSHFETLAGNATYRTNFVNNLVSFVAQYGLDGVDIDWEYPDDGGSAGNYLALMQQLATEMHNRGKLLTAAVVAYGGSSILNGVFDVVDFLNIMAYDENDYQHSTYALAVQAVNYWRGRGLSAAKTVLGVPFYGHPTWESYAALIARGADPYSDTFDGVGYNGITTIKSKTNLAFDQGGGIMMWELSQDATGAYSLLSAIHDVVVSRGGGGGGNTGVIEAESYSSMSGIQTEACTDAGGGSDVGYIDTGDWMAYSNVSFPTTGDYTIQYRVASLSGGGKISADLNAGSIQLGSVDVPSTGGWQNWTTISLTVHVTAGTYSLGLYAAAGGFNVNWLKVTPVSAVFTTTVQAESYSNMSGIQTETCTDAGGGADVAYVDAGDWMAYYNINFPSTGAYKVEYRVASVSGGNLSLDLNAGSIQLGAVSIPATGGWQTWTTVSNTVNVTAGTYNLGVYAVTGGWNLNWVKITYLGASASAASKTVAAGAQAVSLEVTGGTPQGLSIYPNPVHDDLRILVSEELTGGQVRVYDISGKQVIALQRAGGHVDVSQLRPGVYTLVISSQAKMVTKMFIKR